MEDREVFKPLLAVGMQYAKDLAPKMSKEDSDTIKSILDRFLEGQCTFEEAAEVYRSTIGTIHPLEKIDAVLKVDDKPIVPQSENVNQYQSMYSYQNQSRKKTHPWSELEDQRLLSGIHKFGLDNWAAVCAHVGNARTRAQCSQRWFRGLDPRISKVLWTPEEDAKLIELVEKYGDRCWTKIASELRNRSDAQCRYHYRQLTKDSNDDEKSIGDGHGHVPAVFSAPSSQFRAQMQPILPSQSQFLLPNHFNKIPPITSFLADVSRMPKHLRFELPIESGTVDNSVNQTK